MTIFLLICIKKRISSVRRATENEQKLQENEKKKIQKYEKKQAPFTCVPSM